MNEIVTLDYVDQATYADALQDINAIYSSSPDPALAGHQAYVNFLLLFYGFSGVYGILVVGWSIGSGDFL